LCSGATAAGFGARHWLVIELLNELDEFFYVAYEDPFEARDYIRAYMDHPYPVFVHWLRERQGPVQDVILAANPVERFLARRRVRQTARA